MLAKAISAAPATTYRLPRYVPLRVARGANASGKPRSAGAKPCISRAKRDSSDTQPNISDSKGGKGGFSTCTDFGVEYPWATVVPQKQHPFLPFTALGLNLLRALVPRLLLADRLVPRFNESSIYFYIYEILAAIVALDLGKVLVCPLLPGGEMAEEEEEDEEAARNLHSTDNEEVQPALGASRIRNWSPPNLRSLMQHQLQGQRKGGCIYFHRYHFIAAFTQVVFCFAARMA